RLVEHDPEQVVLTEQLDDVPWKLRALVDLRRARGDPLARNRAHEVADLALLVGQRVEGAHGRSVVRPFICRYRTYDDPVSDPRADAHGDDARLRRHAARARVGPGLAPRRPTGWDGRCRRGSSQARTRRGSARSGR